MTRVRALLGMAAALALCACGRVGNLEQPAPLYGAKAKADYQARKAAADAARAQKDDDQIEPLPKAGPYQPGPDPATLHAQPVPGMHASPNGAAQPGVLPDPYAHPQ